MKRTRKSNRVSWAPGPYLRQIKLFYSDEDHSSKVGEKSQDRHRAKTPMVTSTTEDDLPPGFEGNRFQNPSKLELSRIPQIKWECPPMFALNNHWRVAAGEDSKAKDYEKLREKRVFEAMYPRISAIPSSPYTSSEVENESYDDNLTPHIPIEVRNDDDDDISDISIEEREAIADPEPHVADTEHENTLTGLQPQQLQPATSSIATQCHTSVVPLCTCGKPLLQTTLVADLLAASAVVAAFMKCNEELLKIFNDPIMMDKLIRQYKAVTASITAFSSAVSIPNSDSQPPATSSVPISKPTPESEVSETTPTNTVHSLLPASETRQSTPSVSLLTPTPENPNVLEKDAVSSVSLLTSTLEKPATVTPPVPLSKPVLYQSAATTSVTMPTYLPPPISTPHMYRPVNKNIPLVPNTVVSSTLDWLAIPPVPLSMPLSGQSAATGSLTMSPPLPPPISTPLMYRPVNKNIPLVPDGVWHFSKSYSPQQTQAVSSGAKRAAPSASVPSIEFNTLAVPSVSANIHADAKDVRSTQPGAGSTSSVVKDVTYYKNLIWQHGSEKKRKQDSQIEGTYHNKSITKPEEVKFKKQCKFFKSSKGCRNGSNCTFQHDSSEAVNVPVAQSAKRVNEGTEVKRRVES